MIRSHAFRPPFLLLRLRNFFMRDSLKPKVLIASYLEPSSLLGLGAKFPITTLTRILIPRESVSALVTERETTTFVRGLISLRSACDLSSRELRVLL